MKLILSISIFILLLTTSTIAKEYTVVIKSIETKQGIPHAQLSIFCDTRLVQLEANDNGQVFFPSQNTGCNIVAEAKGFETKHNVIIKDSFSIIYLEKSNTILQDVVVTGQPKHVLAEKSIYKINVINTATLRNQAANTLADALAMQTNFFNQQDNILGSTINMQGIGGQNIKILMNGVPMNGRENGNIDMGQINIANVERIEIVKGPMSVLYGTDALGGVVNVITKPNPRKRKIEMQSYAESTNKVNNNILFGLANKRHSFSTSIGRNFFGGYLFEDTFKRSQLWKPKQQYTVDANYTYKTSKGSIIYTPYFVNEKIANRGVPIIDAFSGYGVDEYYKTNRISNTVIIDYEIDSARKLTFSNNASIYHRTKSKYAKDLVSGTQQLTTNRGDQDTTTFVDYNFRGFYNSQTNDLASFLVGYEINFQTGTSSKLINNKALLSDFAIYISLPIKLNKRLSFQPALRIATNSLYKAPITPSFNLRYEFPKKVILRASYARGFRAPSLKELYLSFVDINHNITGNDSLDAEIGNQYQAHVDAPIYNNKNFKLKLGSSTYYNRIRNQISLVATDIQTNTFTYTNIDNFINLSQEINAQAQYKKWKSSVALNINNIFTADSNRGFINKELVLMNQYNFAKINTNFNVYYRYISKQAVLGISTIGSDAAYNAYLPAMQFLDANCSKTFFNEKLNVQLGVRNILNLKSLAISGNTNAIHGSNGTQNISTGRSIFVNVRYSLE